MPIGRPTSVFPAHTILRLQKTVGNAAVQRWLQRRRPLPVGSPAPIQRMSTAQAIEARLADSVVYVMQGPGQYEAVKIVEAPEDEMVRVWSPGSGAMSMVNLAQVERAVPAGAAEVGALPAAGGDAGYAAALAQHTKDRQALVEAVLQAMRSPDRRLRNSAEWVLAGRIKLYALTETHDSVARAAANGKPNLRAFFGHGGSDPAAGDAPGHVFGAPVPYNKDNQADTNGVLFDADNSGGFNMPGKPKIWINRPSQIDALNAIRAANQQGQFAPVAETLKHETQHVSDIEFRAAAHATVLGDVDAYSAFEEYKTEYRAYIAQDPAWLKKEAPADLRFQGYAWRDKAQYHIFEHLYTSYDRIRAAWDRNPVVPDAGSFRDAVHQFPGPGVTLSHNPHNSIRVEDYWQQIKQYQFAEIFLAIAQKPAKEAEAEARRQEYAAQGEKLIEAAIRLDADDRALVLGDDVFVGALRHQPPLIQELVGALLADPAFDYRAFLAKKMLTEGPEGKWLAFKEKTNAWLLEHPLPNVPLVLEDPISELSWKAKEPIMKGSEEFWFKENFGQGIYANLTRHHQPGQKAVILQINEEDELVVHKEVAAPAEWTQAK